MGVICSGGSLLAGGAGRTDLLGDEHTRSLAHAQWRSVNRLLETLDERTVVLPTHGFGSFCAATPIAGGDPDELTIGHERTRNSATRLEADDYVENMIANLPPIPRYYRHMAPLNRAGGRPFELGTLKRVPLDSLEREIVGAGFVIDVRPRRVFARQHRRGAWNLELGPNLATYLGWVVPYFAPFTLIAEGEDDIDRARAALARIGRETVAAWASSEELERNGPGVGSYPVATFADLGVITRNSGSPEIIDVRHPAEWRAGHLRDARHVPLPELTNVRATLPDDQPIWVHCAAGFRAAVASSMLASAGRSPVLVDDVFEHAALAGLEIESGDVSVPGAIPDRVRP